MDIKAKHLNGTPIKELCRQTGISRNTIRKIVRGKHPGVYTRSAKAKPVLSNFEPYLREHWRDHNAARLYQDIKAMGYTGSEVTVRRFRAKLKGEHGVPAEATLRFETPPGRQAQVDWGEVGRLTDRNGPEDRLRKLYVFVYVLGHSRRMYAEFTFSMKLPHLIRCHQNAFDYMGGWPEAILTDNMAQVRLPNGTLTPLFADFAGHHGFETKTHRPYRPQTKGKVERMVGYLKTNFLPGKTFADLDEANRQLRHWLDTLANQRVHGTTGRVPDELFAEVEAKVLTPLDAATRYPIPDVESRKVNRESTVRFRGNRYSVPPRHLGAKVEVESRAGSIRVHLGDTVIAEHPEATGKGHDIWEEAHFQALNELTAAAIAAAGPPNSRASRDFTTPPGVEVRDLGEYADFAAFVGPAVSREVAS